VTLRTAEELPPAGEWLPHLAAGLLVRRVAVKAEESSEAVEARWFVHPAVAAFAVELAQEGCSRLDMGLATALGRRGLGPRLRDSGQLLEPTEYLAQSERP
jgi:hypothetical protein